MSVFLWGCDSVRGPSNRHGPESLSDQRFWDFIIASSEPDHPFKPTDGFGSDNLISNERSYQEVIPALQAGSASGAYVGVGPEQNFTYIAALRPAIAFVVDIDEGMPCFTLSTKR